MECGEWIVTNEEVRRRAGIERKLASRAYQRVLRWFGHVERMDEYRVARRVLMAEVSGGRVRGRPRLGWMDGVKVALGNRGMMVEAHMERGGMPLHDAVGLNCKKDATTENHGSGVKYMEYGVYNDNCVCVCVCVI